MGKNTHFSAVVVRLLPAAAIQDPAANSAAAIVQRHHFSLSFTVYVLFSTIWTPNTPSLKKDVGSPDNAFSGCRGET